MTTDINIPQIKEAFKQQIEINKKLTQDIALLEKTIWSLINTAEPNLSNRLRENYYQNRAENQQINTDISKIAAETKKIEEALDRMIITK